MLHLLKDGRNSKTQLQWSHLKWKRICIAELVLFQILKVIKFKLNTQLTCQIKVYSKSKLQCFIKEVYLKCYVYTCIIFPGLIEITVCWGLQYLWLMNFSALHDFVYTFVFWDMLIGSSLVNASSVKVRQILHDFTRQFPICWDKDCLT